MRHDAYEPNAEAIPARAFVSERFLSEFFRAIEREGLSVTTLLGDLPITLGEEGEVSRPVEWVHFSEFMKRLARAVGGAAGLERCGESMAKFAPSAAFSGLAGLAASPTSLFRTASGWALQRAIPGIETDLTLVKDHHLLIHARIADELRPCPEIFQFGIGAARALPHMIGLCDAVVDASIGERQADYRITLPPSPTLWAKLRRFFRTVFSATSVLRYLETSQLELQAKNAELQSANTALAESERRYRTITETAVDVLCEIDSTGRIVYVSPSIRDLIGYSPEQVTGSHYRLWIPRRWHERVDETFECLIGLPEGRATKELIRLHAESDERVLAELTARSYDDQDGERRIVCILRDLSDRTQSTQRRLVDTVRDESEQSDSAIDASAEMYEVVQRAMVVSSAPTLGESSDAGWIETRKTLFAVRDAILAGEDANAAPIGIHLDLEGAPAVIRIDESLLATTLGGLLEWAVEQARASAVLEPTDVAPAIRVKVTQGPERASWRSLIVQVAVPTASAKYDDKVGVLALELADAAAISMGARIRRANASTGVSRSLVLPLPAYDTNAS